MKKTIVTLVSFMVFMIARAQEAELLSLQSAISVKDARGNFVAIREWIGQEIRINFNLSARRVRLFSKGMFDRDTFNLDNEIFLLDRIISGDNVDERKFKGVDQSGKKCIVRLQLTKDQYKMPDGELLIEYSDKLQIFKIRNFAKRSNLDNS